jgi:hypothetical protein
MADTEILKELHSKIDNVLAILNGNGKIGLCAQVEINKDSIDGIKKSPDKIGQWLVRSVGLILAIGQILIVYKIILK